MLRHEPCELRFELLENNSLDAIITDSPYAVSEKDITGGEVEIGGFSDRRAIQRDMGEWDKDFDPAPFVKNAARVLAPGGWFVTFSGDKMFGQYYTLLKRGGKFAFKFAAGWHRTNPTISIRQTTLVSSMEYILAAVRLDEKGKRVKPIAWNWLGQTNMHNFIEGPNCGPPERLYWHVVKGEIFPCPQKLFCRLCKRGDMERRRHPTQKPLYIWEWLYNIVTKEGMRVYDPYAGVGSSGIAAARYDLEWFGSEIDEEFAAAGKLWHEGRWEFPNTEQTAWPLF